MSLLFKVVKFRLHADTERHFPIHGNTTGSNFNMSWDESHHIVSGPKYTPSEEKMQFIWSGWVAFIRVPQFRTGFPTPNTQGLQWVVFNRGALSYFLCMVETLHLPTSFDPSFWPCTSAGSQFWFSLINKLEADWHVWYLVKQSLKLHPCPNYYIWFCQCKLRVNLVNKSFRSIIYPFVQLLLLVSAEGWSQIIQNRNTLGSFLLLVWKYLLISQFK